MPFPLTVGSVSLADPPALAAAALADARAGGSTLIPGEGPSSWVPGLVGGGALEARIATALAGVLISTPQAGPVAEGARLAAALGAPALRDVVAAALDGHDTGILLHPDPLVPGRSVEEALLLARVRLGPHADPLGRTRLMARLRDAGMTLEELEVLLEHGDPEEIRRGLPDLLVGGLPEGSGPVLARCRTRGEAFEQILETAVPSP